MKKKMNKTAVLLAATLALTAFSACSRDVETTMSKETRVTETMESEVSETPPSETTTAETATETTTETTETRVTETMESEVSETPPSETAAESPASKLFEAQVLNKIGEHTYYPQELFQRDREKKYKNDILSQLEEADKELHDDVYVHGVGESEIKDRFRFFGKAMMDDVVLESADMTCWYDEGQGSHWEINSDFRRTGFDKSGLIDPADVFAKVYDGASKSKKALREGKGSISGSYMLIVRNDGTLCYRFTINKYSEVDVDAKSGEILSERYWDGRYT